VGVLSMKEVINAIKKYQKEIKNLEQELLTSPDGYLVRKKNYYYQKVGAQENSITKNPDLIRQLCRKRYAQTRVSQLKNNILTLIDDSSAIDLRNHHELIHGFSKSYQGLPISYFYHPGIEKWVKADYKKHPYPPAKHDQVTKNGVVMRSKSELLIASRLEDYQIPYRYEEAFLLNRKNEYPDFTIRNPFTGKFIVWEHFGALNRDGYERQMNEKMDAYLRNGYAPGDNFIYTFEFQSNNASRVQEIIENVIL